MELQTLRVPLELDSSKFNKGLDSALSGIGTLGTGIAAGLAVAVAAIGAFVAVSAVAIDKSFEWAEALDKLGDVTGMESKQLSAWSFVAKKAGVPVDTLSRSMVILEKGLVKADGTLDTMGKELKDFGVDVFAANGKVKDQSQLMDDIATKYASFSTQQERVNFLTGVFGRSGAELIDVFDTLAAEGGIDAVTKKVTDLGLVVDSSQYETFQRNLNEIQLTFTGLANAFTGPLLPGAQRILDVFTKWLQSPWIRDAIQDIGNALGGLMDKVATILETGDVSALWDNLLTSVKKIDWAAISDKLITGIKNIDWFAVGKGISTVGDLVADAITEAIANIKWADLAEATATAFMQIFAGALGAQEASWQSIWEKMKQNQDINQAEMHANAIRGWTELGVGLWTIWNIMLLNQREQQNRMRETALQGWRSIFDGLSTIWNNIRNAVESTFNNIVGSVINSVNSIIQQINRIPNVNIGYLNNPINRTYYTGGRAYGGFGSGMTWVGERGIELVDLPTGSYVHNNEESKAMMPTADEIGRATAKYLVQALQVSGVV